MVVFKIPLTTTIYTKYLKKNRKKKQPIIAENNYLEITCLGK